MSPVNGSTKQSIGVKRKRPTNEPNGKRQLQSITKEDLLTQSLAGPWEPVSNNQSKCIIPAFRYFSLSDVLMTIELDARSDINRNYPITDSQLNYTKSSGIADIEPGEVSDNNMETIIDADYFIEKSVRIKEYSDLKSTEVGDNVEDKAVERPQFVTEDTIPPLVNTYPENSILNKALNDMLSLWYQAGYATGRYNTLLEMQQKNSDAI